ncbi:beta-class phenol-soluble modulin [Staphylococcus aureus]
MSKLAEAIANTVKAAQEINILHRNGYRMATYGDISV